MESRSMSVVSMAQHNRDLVLDLLRREGTLSRTEVGERIGASAATVNRLTTDLLRRGLVIDAGSAPSSGGRPAMLLRFNAEAAWTVAVDVRANQTRAALVDLAGTVGDVVEVAAGPGSRRERVQGVVDLAARMVALASDTGRRVLGVGVAVPGTVSTNGVVEWAPVLSWRQVPLARMATAATNLPVVVENDANVLAVAEHRHGAAAGVGCLVAMILGNGIGAGVIVGERLYRGTRASAGEVGYMLMGTESLGRTYAGFGDMESRVGGEGIARRSRELGLRTRTGADATAADVFELARAGEPVAERLVAQVSDELAVAVANVAAVLDPDAMIIGGGIGRSADLIVPRLAERLEGRIPFVPRLLGPSFTDGVLMGASVLALDAVGSLDAAL